MPPLSNAAKVTLGPCQVRLWREDQWKESLHAWRGQRTPAELMLLQSWWPMLMRLEEGTNRSLLPHYPTLFSVDPFTPFANDHEMPFYLNMEKAVAGGLSCVVPGIGSNYASQSSLRNPSTDDHSFLSTIGTRLSFQQLQGPLANSHQEPNLASLTNMEHRPHQSHPRIMSSSGLESIEGQVSPYNYWEFENHSDTFNYPLDFEDPASMAGFDQITSMSIDGFNSNV
ncbi:hypothetical protein VE02_09479 [Pseudogymnoascus sp. 03VT05]|nr:hypothetical protein VE02_09479 [Pseudogymnoascus sp. 03VT05]